MSLSKKSIEEKNDLKDFLKIASELKANNKILYEGYKNRMIGALEAQKILKI
ncbi:hypothetical protein [Paraclostridium sordellii]|uniref:hypothetical protein n=1 Tax=Paraclostridium sordellii TaxID=1505 RepID=UPI00131517E8|nr:hypothetical protein [Paeniclostridium sordellii]